MDNNNNDNYYYNFTKLKKVCSVNFPQTLKVPDTNMKSSDLADILYSTEKKIQYFSLIPFMKPKQSLVNQ